jgi:hypothetical protein
MPRTYREAGGSVYCKEGLGVSIKFASKGKAGDLRKDLRPREPHSLSVY